MSDKQLKDAIKSLSKAESALLKAKKKQLNAQNRVNKEIGRIKRLKLQYGGSSLYELSPNLKLLLNSQLFDTTSYNPLIKLKSLMKLYISTPWDPKNKRLMNKQQYFRLFSVAKVPDDICTRQHSQISQDMKSVICQSHGGDLFEHSQWSALQMFKWFKDNHPIVAGLDPELAILSTFFHDIGKGIDCIYDMYDSKKYNGRGDATHPEYSGDVIMGKIQVGDCLTGGTINIPGILNKYFPTADIRIIALTAYMHWEFGKLNIPNNLSLDAKVDNYLNTFIEHCIKVGLSPTSNLLQLCIAVGCADISAGSNKRLLGMDIDDVVVANSVYYSKDPWVAFGMDNKFMGYATSVLEKFNLDRQHPRV